MSYSKNRLKKRNILKVFFVLFIVVLVLGIVIFFIANKKDNVLVEYINYNADSVSDDIAKNSKPIIVDNILLGAVYNDSFVSCDKYLSLSNNKVNTEVDIYTSRGKSGTFKINNITKKDTYTQVITSSMNVSEEYIALPVNEVCAMPIVPVKLEPTEDDYKAVESALGKYRLLNNSVNILSAYDVSINLNNTFKIICAISSDNSGGIYSAVIYTNSNNTNSRIIKYSYIKDKTNSSDFPIYAFEFAADLNNDGNSELIIREVNEFEVKYDILEYDGKDFVEVLSSVVKIEK